MYYKVTETETINALQNIIVGNLKNCQRIFKRQHSENLRVCIVVCVLSLHVCVFCFNFSLLKN